MTGLFLEIIYGRKPPLVKFELTRKKDLNGFPGNMVPVSTGQTFGSRIKTKPAEINRLVGVQRFKLLFFFDWIYTRGGLILL